MPIELIEPDDETSTEYILVSDKDSEILKSETGPGALKSVVDLAKIIRRADGAVTIFKATKY